MSPPLTLNLNRQLAWLRSHTFGNQAHRYPQTNGSAPEYPAPTRQAVLLRVGVGRAAARAILSRRRAARDKRQYHHPKNDNSPRHQDCSRSKGLHVPDQQLSLRIAGGCLNRAWKPKRSSMRNDPLDSNDTPATTPRRLDFSEPAYCLSWPRARPEKRP